MVTAPLEDIVARGVDPKRKLLFVIDGSRSAENSGDNHNLLSTMFAPFSRALGQSATANLAQAGKGADAFMKSL